MTSLRPKVTSELCVGWGCMHVCVHMCMYLLKEFHSNMRRSWHTQTKESLGNRLSWNVRGERMLNIIKAEFTYPWGHKSYVGPRERKGVSLGRLLVKRMCCGWRGMKRLQYKEQERLKRTCWLNLIDTWQRNKSETREETFAGSCVVHCFGKGSEEQDRDYLKDRLKYSESLRSSCLKRGVIE